MGKYKIHPEKRDFFLRDEEQDYAKILSILGDCRFMVKLEKSGNEVIGHVRGSMKTKNKSLWIYKEDIVLVSLREFQSEKVEIIHKYNNEEIKKLIKKGELSNFIDSEDDNIDMVDLSYNNENTENKEFDIDSI